MDRKKDAILKATAALTENYKNEELFMPKNGRSLPSRAVIIDVVKELRAVIFPGYFRSDSAAGMFPEYYTGYRLNDLYDRLKEQIEIALLYANQEMEQQEASEQADRICGGFFEKLPEVQERLLKDVQAGFDGDPAAKSKEEIISSSSFFLSILGISILLRKMSVGTLYLSRRRQRVLTCPVMPSWAETMRMAASKADRDRSISLEKSTWPGVSINVIPFPKRASFA